MIVCGRSATLPFGSTNHLVPDTGCVLRKRIGPRSIKHRLCRLSGDDDKTGCGERFRVMYNRKSGVRISKIWRLVLRCLPRPRETADAVSSLVDRLRHRPTQCAIVCETVWLVVDQGMCFQC